MRCGSKEYSSLYAEYDPEVEMRVVREEAFEDGMERGLEQGMEKSRQYVLELLNQGLTIDEIKERLN